MPTDGCAGLLTIAAEGDQILGGNCLVGAHIQFPQIFFHVRAEWQIAVIRSIVREVGTDYHERFLIHHSLEHRGDLACGRFVQLADDDGHELEFAQRQL